MSFYQRAHYPPVPGPRQYFRCGDCGLLCGSAVTIFAIGFFIGGDIQPKLVTVLTPATSTVPRILIIERQSNVGVMSWLDHSVTRSLKLVNERYTTRLVP
jgi:hypothetical protein